MSDSNWHIRNGEDGQPARIIVNETRPIELEGVYNYKLYTPIILVPINKSSTLVLSEYIETDNSLGLKIHDLRVVPSETGEGEQIVSSIVFTLRASDYHLRKFKHEMIRVCDQDRCVGISYFLRKLNYTGFSTIYVPKTLKPKKHSTLRAAVGLVTATVEANTTSSEDGGI